MIKNCLSATSIVALTLTMSVSTQVFAAVANFGSYGVNGREVAAPSWKRGVHDGPWPEPVRRADVGLWQTCCGLTIQERVLTQRKRPRPLAKMAFFRRPAGGGGAHLIPVRRCWMPCAQFRLPSFRPWASSTWSGHRSHSLQLPEIYQASADRDHPAAP